MAKMRISTQLGLLVGGGMLMLTLVSAAGMWGIQRSNAALLTVHDDRMVPVTDLAAIEGKMFRNRVELSLASLDPSPQRVQDATQKVEANIASISKLWDGYLATYLTPEEKLLADKFAEARTRFVKEGLRPTLAALKDGEHDKARALVADALVRLHEPASRHLEALISLQQSVAKQEYEEAVVRQRLLLTAITTAGLLSLLLAGGTGLLITRRLTRSLGAEPDDLREIVEGVSKGDLSRDIQLRANDNGSVLASLKSMVATLSQSVGSVRRNADSVATAAAQIAQGNMDLSGRTEQQASALEQTAASMEQLGSTVRQNADNARQANQLAMSASTVAEQGGHVVAQVVDTMKGINDSSKKIADIISVIDGIAFQTNILALNAAVEAARAGEQGRGFAVVAGEVRSLAQRSAEAAKEIKALITSSVERVGQGSELVDRAGHTMEEVVSSIKRVTDIMGEISAASAEQSAGVAQVGQAITQMDQATQQNAALVEQSAAAAASLKSQAQQLVQAVAAFQLSEAGGSLDLFDSPDPAPAPAPIATPKATVREPAAAAPTLAAPPAADTTAPERTRPASTAAPVAAAAAATTAPAVATAGGEDDWATF